MSDHSRKRKASRARSRMDSRRHQTADERHHGHPPAQAALVQGERLVLRFSVWLVALVGSFNALFYVWIVQTDVFESYLALNAAFSAKLLRVLGIHATASGSLVTGSGFSLSIARGCDAIQVSAFFAMLVLAWPLRVSRFRRLVGLTVGVLALLVFNLVRVVSLYCAGVYWPSAFEALHIDVWQPVFILAALLLWAIWLGWSKDTNTENASC